MYKKMHLYIAISAGAVATAVNIYFQTDLFNTCVRLIIVLLLFYVLGAIAEDYVNTKIFPKKENDEEPTESTEADEAGVYNEYPEMTEPYDDTYAGEFSDVNQDIDMDEDLY